MYPSLFESALTGVDDKTLAINVTDIERRDLLISLYERLLMFTGKSDVDVPRFKSLGFINRAEL